MPKAIIFDFDGVIVDSDETHLQAWSKTYEKLYNKTLKPEQLQRLVGHSTRTIASILKSYAMDPTTPTTLIAEEKTSYLLRIETPPPLMPGLIQLLQALRVREIPFGIVSNSPTQFLLRSLSLHKIECPVVLGVDQINKPKPAPDGFIKGGTLLTKSHNHAEIMVLEDSVHGIEAAIQAQMIAIGVGQQKQSLLNAGAKAVISTTGELLHQPWFTDLSILNKS